MIIFGQKFLDQNKFPLRQKKRFQRNKVLENLYFSKEILSKVIFCLEKLRKDERDLKKKQKEEKKRKTQQTQK